MSEHELENLLGGFAADTLTEAERQALYKVALTDQTLFNALADEQALKELLADPAVRRKLLQALEQKHQTSAAGLLSWLDWFRRPAGLAYAGGLTAAALAVVLGTRVYQDNLEQLAEPAATEQPQIAAPPQPTSAPPPPTADMSRMDESRSADKLAPSPPGARKRAIAPPATVAQPIAPSQEQDKAKSASLAPAPAPMPTMKDTPTVAPATEPVYKQSPVGQSDERKPARKQDQLDQAAGRAEELREAPAALLLPAPPPVESVTPPSPFASALSAKPDPGARDLFYKNIAETSVQLEQRAKTGVAEEASPGAGAMADAPQKEMKRAERSAGLLGKLEGAKTSPVHPLGLRYSLIMAGPGGIDLEVDHTTPVGKDDTPRLTVEANEDGYLFVFHQDHNNQRTMLFPLSPLSSEHEEARIVHRKRYLISLAGLFASQPLAGELRLVILFSRAPQRDVKSSTSAHKSSQHLLVETIDPSQPGSPQEQAVYVINPAPSQSASILVEVPLTVR